MNQAALTRRIRTHVLIAALLHAATVSPAMGTEERHGRFDGTWDTVLSCSNSNGALGYAFRFSSLVKDDVLHGEKGVKGEPGWLQLNGRILRDGASDLLVDGLVGAAPYAVGQRPPGSSYAYHVAAEFSETAGSGHRVEGRPCTLKFEKQH